MNVSPELIAQILPPLFVWGWQSPDTFDSPFALLTDFCCSTAPRAEEEISVRPAPHIGIVARKVVGPPCGRDREGLRVVLSVIMDISPGYTFIDVADIGPSGRLHNINVEDCCQVGYRRCLQLFRLRLTQEALA